MADDVDEGGSGEPVPHAFVVRVWWFWRVVAVGLVAFLVHLADREARVQVVVLPVELQGWVDPPSRSGVAGAVVFLLVAALVLLLAFAEWIRVGPDEVVVHVVGHTDRLARSSLLGVARAGGKGKPPYLVLAPDAVVERTSWLAVVGGWIRRVVMGRDDRRRPDPARQRLSGPIPLTLPALMGSDGLARRLGVELRAWNGGPVRRPVELSGPTELIVQVAFAVVAAIRIVVAVALILGG